MNEWTISADNPGYRTKTLRHGNCTIIIERPILLKDEQEKREAQVKATVERGLRDYLIRKERAMQYGGC